ncbi:MAG TPA: tyrosine--tRNA ligase [Candidatus Paceibacterota bacterium]|nr:tyrosine--tRNA ligase [Candidatus Paceibacterota bacterium]
MTKDEQIETFLTKGVSEILPSKDSVEKDLKNGKVLTIYNGIDPTGPTLHLGHTIQLRKLRQLQDMGHKIVFLIGDFTARIGDPTDKMATRVQLTDKDVKTNLKLYKKQASKFINFSGRNAAKIKFNSKWLGKLKFSDVLELASNMTVDQMLKRDMFKRRMEEEKPIYIHEFMYPLMQGYDSVAMNVDGEIGGNDQLFNMLAGRILLKKIKNKEKFVVTVKLLTDSLGEKMGKTTGNMVSLLDTPIDMYRKIMNWSDALIVPGFELCTDYTMSEVGLIRQELERGTNPRDIKMKLSYEITKLCSSEKDAEKAQEAFVTIFNKKEVSEEIPEIENKNRTFEDLLVQERIVSSKSELRRLIEGGAVSNFDTKDLLTVDTAKKVIKEGAYKIGKNRFIKII